MSAAVHLHHPGAQYARRLTIPVLKFFSSLTIVNSESAEHYCTGDWAALPREQNWRIAAERIADGGDAALRVGRLVPVHVRGRPRSSGAAASRRQRAGTVPGTHP